MKQKSDKIQSLSRILEFILSFHSKVRKLSLQDWNEQINYNIEHSKICSVWSTKMMAVHSFETSRHHTPKDHNKLPGEFQLFWHTYWIPFLYVVITYFLCVKITLFWITREYVREAGRGQTLTTWNCQCKFIWVQRR